MHRRVLVRMVVMVVAGRVVGMVVRTLRLADTVFEPW